MASAIRKLYIAQCPKCNEPLKEISYVPVYRCGSCNAILLANCWKTVLARVASQDPEDISSEKSIPLSGDNSNATIADSSPATAPLPSDAVDEVQRTGAERNIDVDNTDDSSQSSSCKMHITTDQSDNDQLYTEESSYLKDEQDKKSISVSLGEHVPRDESYNETATVDDPLTSLSNEDSVCLEDVYIAYNKQGKDSLPPNCISDSICNSSVGDGGHNWDGHQAESSAVNNDDSSETSDPKDASMLQDDICLSNETNMYTEYPNVHINAFNISYPDDKCGNCMFEGTESLNFENLERDSSLEQSPGNVTIEDKGHYLNATDQAETSIKNSEGFCEPSDDADILEKIHSIKSHSEGAIVSTKSSDIQLHAPYGNVSSTIRCRQPTSEEPDTQNSKDPECNAYEQNILECDFDGQKFDKRKNMESDQDEASLEFNEQSVAPSAQKYLSEEVLVDEYFPNETAMNTECPDVHINAFNISYPDDKCGNCMFEGTESLNFENLERDSSLKQSPGHISNVTIEYKGHYLNATDRAETSTKNSEDFCESFDDTDILEKIHSIRSHSEGAIVSTKSSDIQLHAPYGNVSSSTFRCRQPTSEEPETRNSKVPECNTYEEFILECNFDAQKLDKRNNMESDQDEASLEFNEQSVVPSAQKYLSEEVLVDECFPNETAMNTECPDVHINAFNISYPDDKCGNSMFEGTESLNFENLERDSSLEQSPGHISNVTVEDKGHYLNVTDRAETSIKNSEDFCEPSDDADILEKIHSIKSYSEGAIVSSKSSDIKLHAPYGNVSSSTIRCRQPTSEDPETRNLKDPECNAYEQNILECNFDGQKFDKRKNMESDQDEASLEFYEQSVAPSAQKYLSEEVLVDECFPNEGVMHVDSSSIHLNAINENLSSDDLCTNLTFGYESWTNKKPEHNPYQQITPPDPSDNGGCSLMVHQSTDNKNIVNSCSVNNICNGVERDFIDVETSTTSTENVEGFQVSISSIGIQQMVNHNLRTGGTRNTKPAKQVADMYSHEEENGSAERRIGVAGANGLSGRGSYEKHIEWDQSDDEGSSYLRDVYNSYHEQDKESVSCMSFDGQTTRDECLDGTSTTDDPLQSLKNEDSACLKDAYPIYNEQDNESLPPNPISDHIFEGMVKNGGHLDGHHAENSTLSNNKSVRNFDHNDSSDVQSDIRLFDETTVGIECLNVHVYALSVSYPDDECGNRMSDSIEILNYQNLECNSSQKGSPECISEGKNGDKGHYHNAAAPAETLKENGEFVDPSDNINMSEKLLADESPSNEAIVNTGSPVINLHTSSEDVSFSSYRCGNSTSEETEARNLENLECSSYEQCGPECMLDERKEDIGKSLDSDLVEVSSDCNEQSVVSSARNNKSEEESVDKCFSKGVTRNIESPNDFDTLNGHVSSGNQFTISTLGEHSSWIIEKPRCESSQQTNFFDALDKNGCSLMMHLTTDNRNIDDFCNRVESDFLDVESSTTSTENTVGFQESIGSFVIQQVHDHNLNTGGIGNANPAKEVIDMCLRGEVSGSSMERDDCLSSSDATENSTSLIGGGNHDERNNGFTSALDEIVEESCVVFAQIDGPHPSACQDSRTTIMESNDLTVIKEETVNLNTAISEEVSLPIHASFLNIEENRSQKGCDAGQFALSNTHGPLLSLVDGPNNINKSEKETVGSECVCNERHGLKEGKVFPNNEASLGSIPADTNDLEPGKYLEKQPSDNPYSLKSQRVTDSVEASEACINLNKQLVPFDNQPNMTLPNRPIEVTEYVENISGSHFFKKKLTDVNLSANENVSPTNKSSLDHDGSFSSTDEMYWNQVLNRRRKRRTSRKTHSPLAAKEKKNDDMASTSNRMSSMSQVLAPAKTRISSNLRHTSKDLVASLPKNQASWPHPKHEVSGSSEEFYSADNRMASESEVPEARRIESNACILISKHHKSNQRLKSKISEEEHIELVRKIDEVRSRLIRSHDQPGGYHPTYARDTERMNQRPTINRHHFEQEQFQPSPSASPASQYRAGTLRSIEKVSEKHMFLQMSGSGEMNCYFNQRQAFNQFVDRVSLYSPPVSRPERVQHIPSGRGLQVHSPGSPFPSYSTLKQEYGTGNMQLGGNHQTKKQHSRPILGGAPFIICNACLQLLRMPEDFQISKKKYKLRCGSCSAILEFSLIGRTHIVPRIPKQG